jgi:hypothetical protein
MRLQLTPFGSLNKNPIYIGKVQRAVDGRVIVLITTMPSLGVKLLSPIIRFLEGLSMRNFYLLCQIDIFLPYLSILLK